MRDGNCSSNARNSVYVRVVWQPSYTETFFSSSILERMLLYCGFSCFSLDVMIMTGCSNKTKTNIVNMVEQSLEVICANANNIHIRI